MKWYLDLIIKCFNPLNGRIPTQWNISYIKPEVVWKKEDKNIVEDDSAKGEK